MEELLSELLLALLAPILEVLLELGGELLFDLLSRSAADLFKPAEPPRPVLTFLACGFLGTLAGAASLAVFPYPLVHPSKVHGVSLIISPAITGVVMSRIGHVLRKRGRQVVPIESFRYAFAFAFGFALIRLLCAR